MTYEDLLWVRSPSAVTIDEETVAEGAYKGTWRAQGLRGLYAGCGITIARSVPSSAVIFWIYDGLRKRFG